MLKGETMKINFILCHSWDGEYILPNIKKERCWGNKKQEETWPFCKRKKIEMLRGKKLQENVAITNVGKP